VRAAARAATRRRPGAAARRALGPLQLRRHQRCPCPKPNPNTEPLPLGLARRAPPRAAEHAARCGAAALTHEALVARVRAAGLARVPDHLKADLLARLRAALEAE
jgi:hypothetical protein